MLSEMLLKHIFSELNDNFGTNPRYFYGNSNEICPPRVFYLVDAVVSIRGRSDLINPRTRKRSPAQMFTQ